jgi:hypothetical protein
MPSGTYKAVRPDNKINKFATEGLPPRYFLSSIENNSMDRKPRADRGVSAKAFSAPEFQKEQA